LRLVGLDRPILRAAAQLRAIHSRLRTPDALQLATALAVSATAFVTNDRELPPIPGLRIVNLDDYCVGR
jgi:predicted nucleic acid-binding protein